MSEPVRGLIVAHASLAGALVSTVGKICGETEDALRPVSNEGRNPAALAEAVARSAGRGPVILFADLAGGSCGFTARKLAADRPETGFVSGINVPMLVDFVFHREMPLDELIDRLVDQGRRGIIGSTAQSSHAGRTPST